VTTQNSTNGHGNGSGSGMRTPDPDFDFGEWKDEEDVSRGQSSQNQRTGVSPARTLRSALRFRIIRAILLERNRPDRHRPHPI
jgi:hypothetical protein